MTYMYIVNQNSIAKNNTERNSSLVTNNNHSICYYKEITLLQEGITICIVSGHIILLI